MSPPRCPIEVGQAILEVNGKTQRNEMLQDRTELRSFTASSLASPREISEEAVAGWVVKVAEKLTTLECCYSYCIYKYTVPAEDF